MSDHKNIYKYPVGRQPAVGRVPSTGRVPAIGRVRIGWPDDGKVRVVLDTNIIICALEGLKKSVSLNNKEHACIEIINRWKLGQFNIGMNGYLYAEYQKTGSRLVMERHILSTHFGELIKLIGDKAISNFRVLVTKQHVSLNYNDDHLFDGLNGDYLVSEDKKDVVCEKVIMRQANFRKLVTAEEFINALNSI